MLADILIWGGLIFGGGTFFILFVLPAIPILWWRMVRGIANLIQGVVVLAIFLPLGAALLLLLLGVAGMVAGL